MEPRFNSKILRKDRGCALMCDLRGQNGGQIWNPREILHKICPNRHQQWLSDTLYGCIKYLESSQLRIPGSGNMINMMSYQSRMIPSPLGLTFAPPTRNWNSKPACPFQLVIWWFYKTRSKLETIGTKCRFYLLDMKMKIQIIRIIHKYFISLWW